MSDSRTKTITILLAAFSVLYLCLIFIPRLSALDEHRLIGDGVMDEHAFDDILPTATPLGTVVPSTTNRAGTSKAQSTAAWMFMVYLNGDNDLSPFTFDAFNKLESVADNPDVNILVLWDRASSGDTKRYAVQYDTDSGQLALYTQNVNYWDMGELNMGAPQTLVDFVNWVKANYPADHYALAIVDHGRGWTGISWDDTDAGDHLSTADMGGALRTITSEGVNKIDLLFFDASLMAMIDSSFADFTNQRV